MANEYNGTLSDFVKGVAKGIKTAKHMGDGESLTIYPSQFQTEISKLHNTSDAIIPFNANTKKTDYILTGYNAYTAAGKLIGAMPDRKDWSESSLEPGADVLIPKGYHNGEGKVTARGIALGATTITIDNETVWSENGAITVTKPYDKDGLSEVIFKYSDENTTYIVNENDVVGLSDIRNYAYLKVPGVDRAETKITVEEIKDNLHNTVINQFKVVATNDQVPGYFSDLGPAIDDEIFTIALDYNSLKAIVKDSNEKQLAYKNIDSGTLDAPSLEYDKESNQLIAKSKVKIAGYLTTSATSEKTTLSAISRAQTTVSASYQDKGRFQISAVNDQKTGYVIEDDSKDAAYAYVIGAADDAGNYVLKQENSSEILLQINAATVSADGPSLSVTTGYIAKADTINVDGVDRAKTTITASKASDDSYLHFTATNAQQTGWVYQDITKDSDDVKVSVDVNKDTTKKQINAIVKNDRNNFTITKKIVDMVEQAIPSVTVDPSTGIVTGSATQTEGYVSAGTQSGILPLSTQAAATITPGTSEKPAVAAGKYTLGAVTIKGDANLKAANIKKDVEIFGVKGTYDNSSTLGTFSAAPSTSEQTYIASEEGYDGFSEFTVQAMPAGEYSVSHTLTAGAGSASATGNISLTAASAQPSSGYYIQATGSGTVSAIGTAMIGAAGYLATGSKSSTSSSKSSNTATQYYIIPTGACTISGGELTAGNGSVSARGTNITLTEVTNEPSTGYYITTTGSGMVSRAAITDTHTEGYIPAKSTTTISATTSKSSNIATQYYRIATETRTVSPDFAEQTVTPTSGYLLSEVTVNAIPGGALSSPSISINSSGVITATSGVSTAGYLSTGASKSNTKSLSTKGAATITPSTKDQTAVSSGYYTTGAVTVKGDSNLTADNIKKGTTIFGVTGIYDNSTTYVSGTKTVSPATTAQTYFASTDGYDGFSSFTVNAIPSDYVKPATIITESKIYSPTEAGDTIKAGTYFIKAATIKACTGTAYISNINDSVDAVGRQYAEISPTEKAKIKADNIKNGITILGITGTYTGSPGSVKIYNNSGSTIAYYLNGEANNQFSLYSNASVSVSSGNSIYLL